MPKVYSNSIKLDYSDADALTADKIYVDATNTVSDAITAASIASPANTVTISSSGADFTTIQDALDNSGGTGVPQANTMFVVYPGTYADDTINFTANNQYVVASQNVSPKTVLITKSSTICNYGTFMGCIVKDIKMVMTLGAGAGYSTIDGGIPSTPGSNSCNFKHCHIEASTTDDITGSGMVAVQGNGIVKIVDGSISYSNTGNRGGNGKKAILIEEDSFLTIDKVEIQVTASGSAVHTAGIRDNSISGELLIQNSTLDVTDSSAISTYGLHIDDGAGTPEIYRNVIHVTNNGNNVGTPFNATCVKIGTKSGSLLSVRSMYNHFHAVADGTTVGGANFSYYLVIDDIRTTAISQFDDIVSADGFTNAGGTYTYVNSPCDGCLQTSSTLSGPSAFTDVDSSTYSLLLADDTLGVSYTATGTCEITIPTSQMILGREITIKDTAGNAGTNAITISTGGTEKIDGVDTLELNSDYSYAVLRTDGLNWFIVS